MDMLLTQVMDSVGATNGTESGLQVDAGKQDLFKLLARCNLKLGQWQATLVEESNPVSQRVAQRSI
jgi:hypothetical protein